MPVFRRLAQNLRLLYPLSENQVFWIPSFSSRRFSEYGSFFEQGFCHRNLVLLLWGNGEGLQTLVPFYSNIQFCAVTGIPSGSVGMQRWI
jgi:hypothetical protein